MTNRWRVPDGSNQHRDEDVDGHFHHFCTYFDSNYLTAGLALYRSISRLLQTFELWILCLDDLTYQVLGALDISNIHRIRLTDLESHDKRLLEVKSDRNRVEYYFTCTASLPRFVFDSDPSVRRVTYLDADQYFFTWPDEFERALRDASIAIHPHRFPLAEEYRNQKVGRFNAGFASFRNDEAGRRCIEWWRDRSIEWCYDRHEDGRFANQQYLDEWPDRFEDVNIIRHKGVGLARWNVENYDIEMEDGRILVDGEPLVFYHFERLRPLTEWLWHPHLHMTSTVKEYIYKPYVHERRRIGEWVREETGWKPRDGAIRNGLLVTNDTMLMNVLRTGYRVAKLGEAALRGDLVVCR